jgi:putative flippase GtrA
MSTQRGELLRSLVRFAVTGGLSVAVDFVVLTLLHGVLHVDLVLSATLGYLASLVVNYSLNHAWVFQSSGDHGRRLLKYGSLVVVNYALTIGVVSGLVAVGVYYLLAKLVVVVINAVLNFTLFRSWVFSAPQAAP